MNKSKKDYRDGVLEGLKMASEELRKYYDRIENGLWFQLKINDIKMDYYINESMKMIDTINSKYK
jgi:hypothetical protein